MAKGDLTRQGRKASVFNRWPQTLRKALKKAQRIDTDTKEIEVSIR